MASTLTKRSTKNLTNTLNEISLDEPKHIDYYNLHKVVAVHPKEQGAVLMTFSRLTYMWNVTIGQNAAYYLFLLNAILAFIHVLQGLLGLVLSVIPSLTPLHRDSYSDYTTWDSTLQMFTLELTNRLSVNVGLYLSIVILILGAMHISFAIQAWLFYQYYTNPTISENELWTSSVAYIELLRDRGVNWQRWLFFGIFFFNVNVIVFYVFGDANFYFLFCIASTTLLIAAVLFMQELEFNSNDPLTCYFGRVFENVLAAHSETANYIYNTIESDPSVKQAFNELTEFHQRSDVSWWGIIIAFIMAAVIQILQWIYFIAKISSHQARWVNYAVVPVLLVGLIVLGVIILFHYLDNPTNVFAIPETASVLPPKEELFSPEEAEEPAEPAPVFDRDLTSPTRYAEELEAWHERERARKARQGKKRTSSLLEKIYHSIQSSHYKTIGPSMSLPKKKLGPYEEQYTIVRNRKSWYRIRWARLGDRFIFEWVFLITWSVFASVFLWVTLAGIINQSPV